MDMLLDGRRCLVTGASAGIGASIARALAREGAMVAATARRADLLEAIARNIGESGHHKPVTIAGDMTVAEDVVRIARTASERIGPIEILVNCAGYSMPVTIDTDDKVWNDAFALNFTALRRMTGELLPSMRRAGFGRVISLTSIMEPPILNATSAAKAAVHVWSKALSRQVAADGVTLNCITPGRIDSEQVNQRLYKLQESRDEFIQRHIPMRRFGEPEDVANLVVFLASPLARYITGTMIAVDGGDEVWSLSACGNCPWTRSVHGMLRHRSRRVSSPAARRMSETVVHADHEP